METGQGARHVQWHWMAKNTYSAIMCFSKAQKKGDGTGI